MDAARERGGVLIRYCEAAGEVARAARGGPPAPPTPRLAFIPAEIALRITALSALTPVRGIELPASGIALAEGEVVTVLRLGHDGAASGPPPLGHDRAASGPIPVRLHEALDSPGPYEPDADWPLPSGSGGAVLCNLGGQRVAITGAVVVATGLFDTAMEGVLWRGERVPVLDVSALYARAEAAIWASRGRAQGATT